jgi:hypothetical protein
MEIAIFPFARKLSLLGAFDTILADTFPAIHPQCSAGYASKAWRYAVALAIEGREVGRAPLFVKK